jgi:plastocyanin
MLQKAGLLARAGVLAAALTAFPVVAIAQTTPVPQAMVELNPSDINSWGFAAAVPVGASITWTNLGSQAHTVTAADGSFDTGLVDPGGQATIQFDVAGTYAYVCTPHPWMKGFIVVTPDAPGASNMAMVEGNPSDINSWGFAANVAAGSTVSWANFGAQAHSVTAADGSFDTGLVAPASAASVSFDTPGLYAYVCTPHPWMKGSVAVK